MNRPYEAKAAEHNFYEAHGATFYPIFTEENSPIEGCSTSMGIYSNTEYPDFGCHEDHEGFCVIEGWGEATVGGQKVILEAGTAFYAPAGTPHRIKKDHDSVDLKIFLFHFPVNGK